MEEKKKTNDLNFFGGIVLVILLALASIFLVCANHGCGGGSGGGGTPSGPTQIAITGKIEYNPAGSLQGIKVSATNKNDQTKIYSSQTDATGTFSIPVPDGTYKLEAEMGTGTTTLNDEIVINGQSYNVGNIKCGAISGKVSLPDGTFPDTIFVKILEMNCAAWPDSTTGDFALAVIMTEPTQNFTVQYYESSGKYKTEEFIVELTKNKNTYIGEYVFEYIAGTLNQDLGEVGSLPSGICVLGKNYFISNLTGSISKYSLNGFLQLEKTVVVGFQPTDITTDGSYLYVTDGKKIYKFNSSLDYLNEIGALPDIKQIEGLVWDSTANCFWIASRFETSIYKLNSDLTIAKTYYLNIPITALAINSGYIWTSDSQGDTLNKFDYANPATLILSLPYSPTRPQGLCWNNNEMFSVSDSTRHAYSHYGE